MDLKDVLDAERGLVQDEWSLSNPTLENCKHLKILGWSLKNPKGEKFYIVHCEHCAKDPEIFGEGYFRSRKTDLKRFIPCGCSPFPKWNESQHRVFCKRKALELGHEFLGFSGDWLGSHTKTILKCREHGIWESTTISSLYFGRSCKKCGDKVSGMSRRKADVMMVESFMASEAFHEETKFTRIDKPKEGGAGLEFYWRVDCPICGESGESISYNLQNGKLCCGCSIHRSREAYINLVKDASTVIAIKFGITNSSKRRTRQQNSKSVFTVENWGVYKFPDVKSCKQAEKECKVMLECGVIPKRDMQDGWSETTWLYNLDKIIEVYNRNGGVRV